MATNLRLSTSVVVKIDVVGPEDLLAAVPKEDPDNVFLNIFGAGAQLNGPSLQLSFEEVQAAKAASLYDFGSPAIWARSLTLTFDLDAPLRVPLDTVTDEQASSLDYVIGKKATPSATTEWTVAALKDPTKWTLSGSFHVQVGGINMPADGYYATLGDSGAPTYAMLHFFAGPNHNTNAGSPVQTMLTKEAPVANALSQIAAPQEPLPAKKSPHCFYFRCYGNPCLPPGDYDVYVRLAAQKYKPITDPTFTFKAGPTAIWFRELGEETAAPGAWKRFVVDEEDEEEAIAARFRIPETHAVQGAYEMALGFDDDQSQGRDLDVTLCFHCPLKSGATTQLVMARSTYRS